MSENCAHFTVVRKPELPWYSVFGNGKAVPTVMCGERQRTVTLFK